MKIESEELKSLIKLRQDMNELGIIFLGKTKKREIIQREISWFLSMIKTAEESEKMKPEHMPNCKVDLNMFDEEEIHPNCTVQVLRNSMTGEYSVGWWDNNEEVNDI